MDFDQLWNKYIIPLEGEILFTVAHRKKNIIEKVTNDFLIRISSNGKRSPKIPKLLFADIYRRLKKDGVVSRVQINSDYGHRRSSIVTPILGKLPNVTVEDNPVRLIWTSK